LGCTSDIALIDSPTIVPATKRFMEAKTRMRKITGWTAVLCLLTMTINLSGQSISAPKVIQLSGVLRTDTGAPLTGVQGLTFGLYKEQTEGVPLWIETQNVTADEQGRYTVLLGATQPDGLPLEFFSSNEARWLDVDVNTPNASEQSRVLLVSVPYALKAADAETLGGKPLSAFMLAPDKSSDSQTSKISADKDTATSAVSGAGTTGAIVKWTDGATGALGDSVLTEAGGNIGVGAAPATKLDIAGATRVTGLTIPSGGAGLEMYYNGFGGLLAFDRSNPGYKELRLEGSPFTFYNAGFEAMRVHTNNNVGVGTTNPGAKLDVGGSARVTGLTPPATGAGLEFYYNGFGGLLAYDRGLPGYKELRLEGSPFTFYNAGFEAMRVHTNGNIGIGTAAPTSKLEIAGNVKVSGGGNGYVFADGSSLASANAAKARGITYLAGCDTCSALADTDDQKTIYLNVIGPMTINSITCFSDAGTPTINLQKDDGSPVNMLPSALQCSTAGATTTTFTAGENLLALNDKVDFVMVTAGGVAKRVTVVIKATID